VKKLAAVVTTSALVAVSSRAAARDVVSLDQKPVALEVTETSILSQQFDARISEGELIQDHGYGSWINRLNIALNWDKLTLGMRLDSSVYWRRPVDQPVCGVDESGACIAPVQLNNVVRDDSSRYRNYLYPAKIFARYRSKSVEATVGDAYVQFGRGLVLSLRKVDELGIDTTVRGAKVTWTSDPFSVTLLGGVLNPTRIDEATGRALVLSREINADPARGIQGDAFGPQPIYGSDRVVGAQIQAGRGLPVVLSTHGARFTRCAPYHYQDNGYVDDGTFKSPFGSCAPSDTETWLATIPGSVTPTIAASEMFLGGQSIEIPSLWKHGNLYVEAAVQRLHHDATPNERNANGNALYAALTTNAGRWTGTLEVKSYRNFYGVTGAVDQSRASAFSGVAYTNVPSAELITQDSAFGFFNACVNGGRQRTDYRVNRELLVYVQGIYAFTKSEIAGGGCDEMGRTISVTGAESTSNRVYDGLGGVEWLFDDNQSQLLASAGGRDDSKANGDPYYSEFHAEYTLTKHITGPYSVELTGRHRLRKEENQNIRVAGEGPAFWRQGEHYTALKISPKWVFSQGIEYTTQIGFPTYYVNGAVLYRFSSESNIRVFAGQQRGGLKCVSGICKVFPAYSGARVELTVRF
jgi:Family of unknown function (DUF6029)